jgi:hypothetical protein
MSNSTVLLNNQREVKEVYVPSYNPMFLERILLQII